MDVGVQIGQYKVIEHIGRGGMADVWSARDETLGRMVAIKTIARNLSSQNDPVVLFEREAKTIANLEYPNILPIYGFGEFQGKLYIAMRFVTGGSLEDTLSQGAMTYEEAVTVGRAIAGALEYAHGEHIVHLDLKPPNILMDSKGAPYLADFGLAAVLGPEGRAQNPGSGTLLYMAPEQLTSDELDHRADIYSFSLVIFHMLTGKLPFEAMTPMALKQLQFQENLPPLDDINPDLPTDLTEILRRGTAIDLKERYSSAIQLMKDVEDVLGLSVAMPAGGAQSVSDTQAGQSTPFVEIVTLVDPRQVEVQEAKDIYERARHAWANGSGRFLLSVTHYMVMSDYYANAEQYNLEYDDAGAQMLLRGAIEYDYHLEHWWQVVGEDGRRWVCLHAIRSETPQARIRAFYRLETMPDADPPQIPKQVAQALSIENDEAATLAALKVLAYRGKLIEGRPDYNVKTQYRGQLLNSLTRVEVETSASSDWHNVTYSQEIDTLVGETALDGRTARIRAAAARTVGTMRSARAVRYIVDQRKQGHPEVLRALSYILDEVPTLPKNIEFMPRFLAWIVNTGRRLTENPMQIVWSFLFAMLGGWIGMGQHIFRTWRFPQSFFESQRVLNTLAGGLFIGFMVGIFTVISLTLPRRLKGFWPLWTRAIWSMVAAYFLGQTIWWTYGWMYLNLTDVPQSIIIFTGVGSAIGLVVAALTNVRGWVAFIITSITTYAALYISTTNYIQTYIRFEEPMFRFSPEYAEFGWVLAYDNPVHVYTILLPLVLLFALGIHFPAILADIRDLFSFRPSGQAATPVPKARPEDGPRTVPIDRATYQELAQPVTAAPLADDSPMTEEFEVRRVRGRASADDLATELKPQVPMTEEFEVDQVGGKGDMDTDWDAIMSPLEATTEEFDTDKVGKDPSTEDLSHNPNLATELKPQVPMTEEFEVDQVGGKEEMDTDWDAIMSPLEATTEEFDTDKVGKDPSSEELAHNPNLATELKPQVPMTEEFEVDQVGEKEDADPSTEEISNPNLQTTLKPEIPPIEEDDQEDDDDSTSDWDLITKQLDDLD